MTAGTVSSRMVRAGVRAGIAMTVAAALARAAAACATTPDLDFVPDASSVDSGLGGGGAADVELTDSSADAVAAADADASVDAPDDVRRANTCPDAAPPNIAQCCGRVRCVGKGCDDSRCDDCRVCAASSVCCIKKVNGAADCVVNIAACK